MNVLRRASDLIAGSQPVCAAIGVFDGIHLGHQRVIHQTMADARAVNGVAVVITFDRHPNEIVAPDHAPALIYPLSKKLRVIEELGAEAALILRFDEAFSRQDASIFIQDLARDFVNLRSLSVGSDFTFGHRRSGHLALLQDLGLQLGFEAHGLEAVLFEGEAISSTRIRKAVQTGDFTTASVMLGRPYTLTGTVTHGDQLGRELGFPTANLLAANLVLPPNGVYAIKSLFQGDWHPSVLNIGCRPTLQDPAPRLQIEAHLLDFHSDLYGAELEISFVGRLRDEKKFPSMNLLHEQITRDIAAARALF